MHPHCGWQTPGWVSKKRNHLFPGISWAKHGHTHAKSWLYLFFLQGLNLFGNVSSSQRSQHRLLLLPSAVLAADPDMRMETAPVFLIDGLAYTINTSHLLHCILRRVHRLRYWHRGNVTGWEVTRYCGLTALPSSTHTALHIHWNDFRRGYKARRGEEKSVLLL